MLDHIITVRADSVEKAVERGLIQLKADREDVDIHIITEGKKGIFGFGKQDAIVEITKKNDLSFKEITEQLEAVEFEKNQPIKKTTEVTSQENHQDKIETKKEIVNDNQPIMKHQDTTLTSDEKQMEHENAESDDSQDDQEDNDDEEANESSSEEGLSLEESSQKVAQYIDEIIKSYGAQSDTEVEVNRNQVIFNIDTDKSGLVIGKHGKIINSLQVLSQTLLQSYYRRRVSVLLNVGDYRDRRANVLEQIADRTAEDVLRTKQTVILDPLPAYERKQIHAHLAKYDRVKTHSEGKEPNRFLVVEYEANNL